LAWRRLELWVADHDESIFRNGIETLSTVDRRPLPEEDPCTKGALRREDVVLILFLEQIGVFR